MPTVLRKSGFRFRIYVDDHEPMHVHVWHQGAKAVIEIATKTVSVRENEGMNKNTLRRAISIAQENLELLRDEWNKING
jgi:DNA/RNA-binding domain of Phe-tRNA-synthetase-like protein